MTNGKYQFHSHSHEGKFKNNLGNSVESSAETHEFPVSLHQAVIGIVFSTLLRRHTVVRVISKYVQLSVQISSQSIQVFNYLKDRTLKNCLILRI